MPDVIDKIEQDHREVEQLFSDFEKTRDPAIAEKICQELDKHTAGEEKAVYPVFAEEVPGEKKLVDEGEDEHKDARQLIGRIRQTTQDDEHLADLMKQLQTAVQHHVKEEETEMLPKAREGLEEARLEELGKDFEAAKQASA